MDQSKVYIVPSLMSLPPTSHPIPPLQVVTEPWFEFPESYSKFPLSILHMLVYMFPCYSLHLSHPVLPTCHVHESVLYAFISIAALQIGPSVPAFQIPYIGINTRYLCFPFWRNSLCIIGLFPSTSLALTQMRSFLWPSNIPLYICGTASPSIHLSMHT